jgi:glutamate-1-semialdehyde 2,1-aminomutase
VNTALAAADLPLRVANLSSVWVTYFTQPGRYHWMLQYYFHNEGLALGWTGTSRLIFSLNFSDEDMVEVTRRIVAAARRMQQDGWWWVDPVTQGRDLGRRVLWEMVAVGFGSDRTRWHASGRTDVRRSPTVPPPPPARP